MVILFHSIYFVKDIRLCLGKDRGEAHSRSRTLDTIV